MKKNLSRLYITLIVAFLVLLTACGASGDRKQEATVATAEYSNAEVQEAPSTAFQIFDDETQEELKNILSKLEAEQEKEQKEELIERPLDFELLEDAFIIEVSRNYKGDQKTLLLKDGFLQFWLNQSVVCVKKIPAPSKVSIGSSFDEVIGNPYISEDGKLVLIQSYTTLEGEPKIDYTILANHCNKIIPVLAYDSYVFQNYEGKYGLAFYRDDSFYWYPYTGFGFNTVEDSNFSLPKPTIIWLNTSTVKSVKFGSWGTTSYGYQDVTAISARLDVESYGELDIANVSGSFEPVEVDKDFFGLLDEKFTPQEYEERFFTVIQTINKYKQKS